MKTRGISLIFFFSALFVTVSCNRDDDSDGGVTTSREVRFEVTGTFTGNIEATFFQSSGGATSEDIGSLPWTKEITYATTVPSIGIAVAGSGGNASETIRVKVFVGGSEKSVTPAMANNTGIIVVTTPSYIFPN